jgi:hypothetical protein
VVSDRPAPVGDHPADGTGAPAGFRLEIGWNPGALVLSIA